MSSSKNTALQGRDTALALTFLLLIIWLFVRHEYVVYAAVAFLLFAMLVPAAMRLPARLWFGLSHVLGAVMSRVLLGAIFCLFVVPVSAVRRLMGKDSLKLRQWKKGTESAFVERAHAFSKEDTHNPY